MITSSTFLLVGATALAVGTRPLANDELVAAAEEYAQELIEADRFSGTALIAKGDEVLWTVAAGEASKRFHVPNDIDTKFNLGSMNKMFTALSIAQLVEEDLLAYDEPISKYVDESWLPAEITELVTIRHLLTHTSGLGSYFNETFMQSSRLRFREVSDYKSLVNGETLAFEPGQGRSYSNTGMLLLGVVIEESTGETYFDYVRENIYAPAGMNDTGCFEMDEPVENLAIGYDPDPESAYGWRNNIYMHVVKGGPAGGGFSTVGDLHRFGQALMSGKLLHRRSLEPLWTDHTGAGYGFGFSVREEPAGKVVGHSGGFPGINSNLDIYLDQGYVVAVMSNCSGGAHELQMRLRELVARAAD